MPPARTGGQEPAHGREHGLGQAVQDRVDAWPGCEPGAAGNQLSRARGNRHTPQIDLEA